MNAIVSLVDDAGDLAARTTGTLSSAKNSSLSMLSGGLGYDYLIAELRRRAMLSTGLSSSVIVLDADHGLPIAPHGVLKSSTTPMVWSLSGESVVSCFASAESQLDVGTIRGELVRLLSLAHHGTTSKIAGTGSSAGAESRVDFFHTIWRRPVRAAAATKRSNIFFDEIRQAARPRSAYEVFERLLRRAAAGERFVLDAMAEFLGNSRAPFRDTLLSCIADREMLLTHGAVLRSLTSLLGSADVEVARSAALALIAGGDASCEALSLALSQVSTARREELKHFLSFASDL